MFLNELVTALMFDLYGLAFFVLGVTVLVVTGHKPVFFFTRHSRWLSGFGLTFGLVGFLAGEAFAGAASLGWPILLLRSVAYGALLEFGRLQWNASVLGRRYFLSAPILYPLLVPALSFPALAVANPQAGLDATLRYLVCLPATLLTGMAILVESRKMQNPLRQLAVQGWLQLLGGTFILFGLLSLPLVLELPEYPWLPTNQDFRQLTSLPVQLPITLCALLIALAYIVLVRKSAAWVFRQSVHNAALVTNEEKFRTLFEMSSDAILTFNRERIIEVNQSCVKMFGYRHRDELIGKNLEDISPPTQPDGTASGTAVLGHVRAAAVHGTHLFEWTHQRSDGSLLQAEIRLTPMPKLGESVVQAIIRDISAYKQAETALRLERDFATQLLDTAPVIVLVLAQDGSIQYVNPYFETLTGYRLDEIRGLDWFETFLPEKIRLEIKALFARALTATPTRGNVNPILLRDGLKKEIEWYDTLLPAVSHQPARLLVVGLDVSMRKEAEAELRLHREHLQELVQERTEEMLSAKNNAERANAAKSEFLSRMSHELRTPLNAIIGFGQLLQLQQDKPNPEDAADYINQIVSAGDHLLSLVNELLDLSRIESGRLHLTLEAVAVRPLVDQCIQQIGPFADSRHIVIVHEPSPHFHVLGDQTRLKQVVLNLLSNAVKYNRLYGEIHISYEPVAGNAVRVSIRDTGKGLVAEELQRLFRPFERLQSGLSSIEGTGIGLALSKNIVEAMSGRIGVSSVPGSGSTFWFELPVTEDLAAFLPVSPLVPALDPMTRHSGQRRTLLYVEDNLANLLLLERYFAKFDGYRLLSAVNAQQGLDLAAREQPDLILMDINLPGINGYAALKILKQNPATRDIPVVAITANAMPDDIAHGKAAGFADYLIKPLNLTSLLDTLERYLRKPPADPAR